MAEQRGGQIFMIPPTTCFRARTDPPGPGRVYLRPLFGERTPKQNNKRRKAKISTDPLDVTVGIYQVH